MKRYIAIALTILTVSTLCGCTADDINSAVNQMGEKVGVDVNVNLTDEDVDKVKDGATKIKDTVTDIAEDEEVRDAFGNLIDAVKGAGKDE